MRPIERALDHLRRGSLLLLSSAFIVSCGSGGSQKGDKGISDTLSTDTAQKEVRTQARTRIEYGVPTPVHMLSLFEKYDEKADEDLLLPTDKAQGLVGTDQQALHLGVYSTDLAYSSVFGMGTQALEYFITVRTLGEKLDITSAFDKETIERIEKMTRSDSLQNISRDTYIEAFNYLRKNERGETLALLVAGGWTEALYLSVNMVDTYEKDDPMVQYVADQKLSFANLRKFMKQHDDNESVASLLQRMKGLEKAYSSLEETGGVGKMEEKDGGRMVLSGGPTIQIDQKGLERIRKEVNSLRKDVVEGKINSSS